MSTIAPPELSEPWALPAEEVLRSLGSDPSRGLSAAEAADRLRVYGPNAIPEPEADPLWRRYWGQLTGDAVVRLLLIGGVVSLLLGDWLEGTAIILMLNIMAGFGLYMEGKADDAARSLRKAGDPRKAVVRDGARQDVAVDAIVPGDLVYLPTGAIAPADARVVAAVNAEKDTSKMTGESMPVEVGLDPLPPGTVANAQRNMIHRGDAVTQGNLTAVVTATGGRTEIGKIAASLGEIEPTPTPLDEQLDSLGGAMAKVFVWIAAVVIGAGLVREFGAHPEKLRSARDVVVILKDAFINAVALIIAAIPEGLPAVLTITLAIASRVMNRHNALVRRPKAVEGGGSMTVLLTDKTGTLTADQMEVTDLYLNGRLVSVAAADPALARDPVTARAVRIARLCNNNSSSTEAALNRWVAQLGFEGFGDLEGRTVEHEFDQSLKRMTTVHPSDREGFGHVFTKGAPEHVLELCHLIHLDHQDLPLDDDRRANVLRAVNGLASKGLRVLALADRHVADAHELGREGTETELTLVGLLGIMDPPRPDVLAAVAELALAGIRTVMVTGDNPVTAYEIARQVGIVEPDLPYEKAVITGEELTGLDDPTPELIAHLQTVRVFARVEPRHKAKIVEAMRAGGFIVGFTGDGLNDAMALKTSDVGFAMGNGMDVARESCDVELTDSRFGTIPFAVEEGRNVLHRIRLYLSYILSGNGCEVGVFVLAYLIGVPIPLTALVLLVINFATDSFPALAMAFEPGETDVMRRPPRRRGLPFINPTMWAHIGVQTVVATAIIMGVYYYYLKVAPIGTDDAGRLASARSAAFLAYISQKLLRAFTARSMTRGLWAIGVFRNRWTLTAVALSLAIALFFVYTPGVNRAMGLAPLAVGPLAVVGLVGFIAPLAEELTKLFVQPPAAGLPPATPA